jgi:hypothetical protein
VKIFWGFLWPPDSAQCLTFSQILLDEKIARVLIDVMTTEAKSLVGMASVDAEADEARPFPANQ